MPKGLPSSPQQHGCYRVLCLLPQNLIQLPSGHTNAAAESFWATLKKEFVHLHPFDTIDRVRAGIFEYVEIYYNRQRLHSSIGYLTPVEFEEEFDGQTLRAA